MLMAATETNAQGGRSAFGEDGNLLQLRSQHKLIPSLLHFLYLAYEL